jgi:hypothetical protein
MEMEAKLTRPASKKSASETTTPAPASVDYGLDGDQFIAGGEMVAETVNLVSGNVIERRQDLRFLSPNRLGLSLEGFYNSRLSSSNRCACGYGWSHTYSAYMTIPDSDSTYIVVDATGRRHYFGLADGNFTGIYQERTSLAAGTGSTAYIWSPLDGSRYGFTNEGKLAWIEDPLKNRLTLTRDSSGKIYQVTDEATGRALTFTFTGSLLTRIDGPASQAALWPRS